MLLTSQWQLLLWKMLIRCSVIMTKVSYLDSIDRWREINKYKSTTPPPTHTHTPKIPENTYYYYYTVNQDL